MVPRGGSAEDGLGDCMPHRCIVVWDLVYTYVYTYVVPVQRLVILSLNV